MGETSYDYAPSTSQETWDQESQRQILSWRKECEDHHITCGESMTEFSTTSPRQLPTRLLDVGISDTQGDGCCPKSNCASFTQRSPKIRLCNTDKLPPDTQYVTLSHCWGYHPTVAWGRHPAITLTNEVLDAFYTNLPLAENTSPESRTFKHAVQVVRELGYRFVWIDALCINQDDPLDKAHEISIMDLTYANAAFNISATASTSGSGGLFYSRNPLSVEPLRRSVLLPGGRKGTIVVHSDRWGDEITDGIVNTRAWVFQERILARRVVHFTHDQVFWECATLHAARSLPRGRPVERKSHQGANNPNNAQPLYSKWSSLIPFYSRCDLTYQQDKLPAISGVARWLQRLYQLDPSDYLAGLWLPGLLEQLLWSTTSASPNTGRSVTYRSPSWSWACLDAETHLQPTYRKRSPQAGCAVELVDVDVQTKSSDRFGEIESDYIRLSGPLCLITCTRSPGSRGDLMLEINGTVYPRQLIQTDWDCIPANSSVTRESVIFSDFPSTPVYLLTFHSYPSIDTYYGMIGLMLEATGYKAGQFSRLGLFKVSDEYPEAHDVLIEACRSKTLKSNAYLEFNGVDRYCVEVV